MEPVRPLVDAYVVDWITRDLLKRSWFFEKPDGNCRLMTSLAIELSKTAPTWARAVAPIAEWVARTLWSRNNKPKFSSVPPTRLTQRNKREARGRSSAPRPVPVVRRENICRACGKTISDEASHCAGCSISFATERFVEVARLGRSVSHTPEARAKQGNTRRRHAKACSSWRVSDQPTWLTAEVYSEQIHPRLAELPNSAIASRIGVSRGYAGRVREGYRPHPRHWLALAELVGVSGNE
jgi:hypothetical protein